MSSSYWNSVFKVCISFHHAEVSLQLNFGQMGMWLFFCYSYSALIWDT